MGSFVASETLGAILQMDGANKEGKKHLVQKKFSNVVEN